MSRFANRHLILLAFPALHCACVLLTGAKPATADETKNERWREVWAGADATSQSWLVYSGVTLAPYGHVYSNGLRLRSSAGYGGYRFEDVRIGATGLEVAKFEADTAFADALVGYLHRFGELTAKGFIGIAAIEHEVSPGGALNAAQGLEYGPKGVIELWLNLGPSAWTSLDLNWTSAHDTYAARLRTGYRMMPSFTAGIEAGLNSSNGFDDQRAGLFLRNDWDGGEVSVSAGISGDVMSGELERATTPFVTVNWLTQF